MGEVNGARAYGVRVLPTSVRPGQVYWRVVEVRHLTPNENRGKHNIYVDAVGPDGQRWVQPSLRIGWTWEGRRADEPAPPKPLDKPAGEPMGNIDLGKGQVTRIWLIDDVPSDAVEGMHTNHPDERGPNGEIWNSTGHHSFYVKLQLATAGGIVVDEGTGPSTGGEIPPPSSDLVAMVQALQLEVAELRRWQAKVKACWQAMIGEL